MAGKLWTPQGVVSTEERPVEALTREEIIILSKMHEVAGRHGISLVCKKCDHSLMGANNDQSKVLAIACQCRELRFDGR